MRTKKDVEAVSRVLLAPIKHASEEEEAISKWIREASAERDREELKRLLYVGCTRARQEVHLFGECREGKNGLGSVRRQTLLHTAWPVAEANFARHWRAQQDLAGTGAKIVEMPAPDGYLYGLGQHGRRRASGFDRGRRRSARLQSSCASVKFSASALRLECARSARGHSNAGRIGVAGSSRRS